MFRSEKPYDGQNAGCTAKSCESRDYGCSAETEIRTGLAELEGLEKTKEKIECGRYIEWLQG